jgi:hypothetical protein
MNILTSKKSPRIVQFARGNFVNKRGETKCDARYSVEEQYSAEELIRIQNAIRMTHSIFGNTAEVELSEMIKKQ